MIDLIKQNKNKENYLKIFQIFKSCAVCRPRETAWFRHQKEKASKHLIHRLSTALM